MIQTFMLTLATMFCTGKSAYSELEVDDFEPTNVIAQV